MQLDPLWLGLIAVVGITAGLISILVRQARRSQVAAVERLRLAVKIEPATRAVLRIDARRAGRGEIVLGAEIIAAAAVLSWGSYVFARLGGAATYWAFGGLGLYGAYRLVRGLQVVIDPGERATELAAQLAGDQNAAAEPDPVRTAVIGPSLAPIRLLAQPAEGGDTTFSVESGAVVEVISEYGAFVHVRTADALDGWIQVSQLRQPS